MNKVIALITLAGFATIALRAATAEPVQMKVIEDIPAAMVYPIRHSDETEPGVLLTYLVTGNRLSEFKPGSLTITDIAGQTASATDIGALTATLDDSFLRVSSSGCAGCFRIKIPTTEAAGLARTLKVKGKVIVLGETPVTVFKPTALPADTAPAVKVGEYTVAAPEADGDNTLIHITGNPDRIRDIVISANGKTVKPLLTRKTQTRVDLTLRLKNKPPLAVGLTVRTADRPELTVPFSYGA
jgi:hypothetical protein